MSRAVQPQQCLGRPRGIFSWMLSGRRIQTGLGLERTGKVQQGCGPCQAAQGDRELLLLSPHEELIQAAQVSAAFPAKIPFPKVVRAMQFPSQGVGAGDTAPRLCRHSWNDHHSLETTWEMHVLHGLIEILACVS